MTPEQLDTAEGVMLESISQLGYCKVAVFIQGNPTPLTGEYERFDSVTVIIHNGKSDRWIVDVAGITAIGVTT